ncbi:MAG: TAXI family TRAP transporter solute-binding subunit [Geminicoccaceae bacterium]|nr:TAXI family TRAP transporter solute-binding subunit [Geminicoccaceae bacterium]
MTRRRTLFKGALLAATALAFAPAAHAETFINVLTGGTSGVYYPLGVAVSTVIGENVKDVRTSVQSTKASVENLNLLEQGKGEVAFALADSVKAAAEGNEEAGFRKPLENLRAIGAIYPNVVQIVASKASGIASLEGLKGKGLSVGAPKSGTELNARAILAAAGMSYDDLGKVEYLPFAESVELMKNRQIDATLQSAGLGVASIRDLASSVPIVMVPVEPALVEKVGQPYQTTTIPADTYDGQDQPVPAAAVPNYLVTRADLDEETVYEMTKAIFDHLDQLVAAHGAAKGIDPAKAAKDPVIPLHPGAERYFKEKGLL